jgi:hypothetical protein
MNDESYFVLAIAVQYNGLKQLWIDDDVRADGANDGSSPAILFAASTGLRV